ncbi:MAG: TonB family protein [Acidobacteria bacterium]|nr:TonB family protein [Acidobacteriota bacterium]
MARQILVIEYEPRYIQRAEDALVATDITSHVARSGDEAGRLMASNRYDLVVLSTIIPRFSTADLVKSVRQNLGPSVPILFTISGYSGSDPKTDAQKLGGQGLLLKPYTVDDFSRKLKEMLPDSSAEEAPFETAPTVQMSSEELFGDLVDRPTLSKEPDPSALTEKVRKVSVEDVDKLLEDTLAGVRIPTLRKRAPAAEPPKESPAPAPADDVDKLLEDTLSGLEGRKKKGPPESPAPSRQTGPEHDLPPFPEATAEPASSGEAGGPVSSDPNQFGQYKLIEKIATGGMAEVWKARMHGLEGFEKIVAIKKILPHLSDNEEFIEMFVDEAKLAAQLNHNNIIHIYDLGKLEESWFIAMEYIDGYDLKSILKMARERVHPLPVPLALFVASKICWALDYAHRKKGFDNEKLGLVHRDVSPQNVLISSEGDIKLCDFGIAKAATKASHTQAGVLKGKLQYMSPEQAWGRQIDHRSDLFATAVVLFEMLAGRKLFQGDSDISVLDQVREAQVPAPSMYEEDVTPEIDEIVLKGLEKDPEARYQTAGEMARAIDQQLFNFKPAPTNLDLAAWIDGLERSARVPTEERPLPLQPVETRSSAESESSEPREIVTPASLITPAPEKVVTEAAAEPEEVVIIDEPPRKRSAVPWIAAILLIGLAGAVGAWYVMAPSRDAGEQAPASEIADRGDVPAPVGIVQPTETAGTIALTGEGLEEEELVPDEQELEPELDAADLARIDQEVRDRLAADRRDAEERQRRQREQLDREREAAARASEPPRRTAQPDRPTPTATPPATTTRSTPLPEEGVPVSTSPEEPRTVEPDPPPPTTRAEEATLEVRTGDFVPPGTPGLVEPELLSLGRKDYPALAKRLRVEGIVIVRALVAETGEVLEAEVLRGISPNVGLNEAAETMVRTGRFRPATKDGVKVRAYKTVTVPFRL